MQNFYKHNIVYAYTGTRGLREQNSLGLCAVQLVKQGVVFTNDDCAIKASRCASFSFFSIITEARELADESLAYRDVFLHYLKIFKNSKVRLEIIQRGHINKTAAADRQSIKLLSGKTRQSSFSFCKSVGHLPRFLWWKVVSTHLGTRHEPTLLRALSA